ncbi:MAG TPA: HesA/MoeB/ThiF family protein, partial [Sphingopyxis sp.]|nr:HesA/MoeB/ThiF family protein [Sphingopyxis sp.]
MLSDAELDRYARQIILPTFGGAGQAKLRAAHVAVVGAGGIGCPAITYLAAAGVGKLTIIDDDAIELSNLQRQPLFTDADIGAPKAGVAADAARRINPHVEAIAIARRLDDANAEALLAGASLILDGCDNFATRLAVNRAAVALEIPLLSAAIGAFEGQVALYEGWRADQACYACLVGNDPDRPGINCAETGVMGALAGMIGTMAALEAVRALTGWGNALTGRLAIVDM